MNSKKLYSILNETTQVYRKGAEVQEREVGNVNVTEVFGYPHTSDAPEESTYEKVDMIFVDVVVDKVKAAKRKEELERILADYPQPERLAGGPSYIELSPNCGLEQEGGLRLMALGKVLGLWEIVNGKVLGTSDEEALILAGNGFIMITGYKAVKK
jgi:hypothetical protein